MTRKQPATETHRLRLDKWLWAARFYRTRGLALEAIGAGRVSVNGVQPKPSRAIGPGDVVTVQRPPYTWEVEVLGLCERRGPAKEATLLYRETAGSEARRRDMAGRQALMRAASPIAHDRPNKRQRREILRFIARLEACIDAGQGNIR